MTQETAPATETPPGNPAAIVSVVTGLMLCIPGLGLISIPTGIVGYRKSQAAGVGRRPAMFGIALGAMNLAWWGAAIIGAIGQYHAMQVAKPAIQGTRQFIMLVGSGNLNAAKAMCADSIDLNRLTDTSVQFQQWGALKDVRDYGGEVHSKSDVEVQVELPFEATDKIMVTHWSVTGTAPQLTAYEFRDAPSTQPTTAPTAGR